MSPPHSKPATQIGPEDPPPEQEPMHDVPVYPDQDPTPGSETEIKAADGPREREREREHEGKSHSDVPSDRDYDVDEDDLDPQAPHSPPDARSLSDLGSL
jgi:hypothetical protein